MSSSYNSLKNGVSTESRTKERPRGRLASLRCAQRMSILLSNQRMRSRATSCPLATTMGTARTCCWANALSRAYRRKGPCSEVAAVRMIMEIA
jgi:hypothetical protein